MKVLFITGSYPPMQCGVGDYTRSLANSLAETSDIEVSVLTSDQIRYSEKAGRVHVYPCIPNWGIGEIRTIIRNIKRINPDIVHIQYPTQGYALPKGHLRTLCISLLPIIVFLMGIKVVQTWHEYENNGLKADLYFLLRAIPPSYTITVRPDFFAKLSSLTKKFARRKLNAHIHGASSIPKSNFSNEYICSQKSLFLGDMQRLIVYFGFIYPHKGVDLIFKVADPLTDKIVIAGGYDCSSSYMETIKDLATSDLWSGHVDILGFTPADEISLLLTIADAVILPFRKEGAGIWNSSVHAVRLHHSFLVTTSNSSVGYDKDNNIYFSKPDDIDDMKHALDQYAGIRLKNAQRSLIDEWSSIANSHSAIYHEMLTQPAHK